MTNHILLLGTGGVSDAVRVKLPAIALHKLPDEDIICSVDSIQEFSAAKDWYTRVDLKKYSTVLYSRPYDPDIVRHFKDAGLRVVIDLDDDFHSIPPRHIGYRAVGPGNPKYLDALEECVSLADSLTVTTAYLRERWLPTCPNIKIIPNGWSKDNRYWGTSWKRDTVNLGWGGTITHRDDFEILLPALVRVTKEFKNVVVVIAGDPLIYAKLHNVNEEQKMFLPHVKYKLWPHVLSYFDVMLAPLVDDTFNKHKSDVKLVDAGAAYIPWIASPIENYLAWEKGGLFANDYHDWHAAMANLVENMEWQPRLAADGYKKALTREMNSLVYLWKEALV